MFNSCGGLDVCSICMEPLSRREISKADRTDSTCDYCMSIIKQTMEEFDFARNKDNE